MATKAEMTKTARGRIPAKEKIASIMIRDATKKFNIAVILDGICF